MQIALFTAAPGDTAGVDNLNHNRFLRGHRVITLDRVWTWVVGRHTETSPRPETIGGPWPDAYV